MRVKVLGKTKVPVRMGYFAAYLDLDGPALRTGAEEDPELIPARFDDDRLLSADRDDVFQPLIREIISINLQDASREA
jgi:hypothetical protein